MNRREKSLRFSGSDAPRATLSARSGAVVSQVTEIGQGWLTVVLLKASPNSLLGQSFDNVLVTFGTQSTVLPRVVVEPHGDGLKLIAADDNTRAAMWLFKDHLTKGPKRPSREMRALGTGVDSIPARGQYTEAARMERLNFIRDESGHPLESLEQTTLLPKRLTSNIENMISSVEVPVGLAGPLLFHGEHARGVVYAPMATTEGTLVASAARGARAITRSGGVTTRVLSQRMLRVPHFALSTLNGAMLFADWIRDHAEQIAEQATKVSRFAQLISVEPQVMGRHVHVAFLYETGDAAGQNMTTSCTWHACQWLMRQMKFFDDIVFENFIIDANMSGDKKVNFQSFIRGRGTRVVAEAFLDRETVEQVLKVTPEQLAKSNHAFMTGSFQVGMIGYNINISNVIAAMFIATGQDVACVHESSLGQLQIELDSDGIQASMLLPSLIVGTVGGGTHLDRQNELLAMMGCAGPGRMAKFAEIIAGFCLSLDLSTLSAIAGGQFAHAHERLGRNRPVEWFVRADLNREFFEAAYAKVHPPAKITAVESLPDIELGSSIITELTARKISKLVGHFPYRLEFENGSVDVVCKVKPIDEEVVLMTNNLASMCLPRLATAFSKFKMQTDFVGCDARELAIYRQTDARFVDHAPKVYGIAEDESRELFTLVLERLGNDVILMDTAADVSGWTTEHIEAAIRGIAEVHSIWYGREGELKKQKWIGFVHDDHSMANMTELWDSLAIHAGEEFPEWITDDDVVAWREIIRDIPNWWPQLNRMTKTLIHNDFNPRNVCLRQTAEGHKLCAYDWELATIGVPQHDLAEFLAFTLDKDCDIAEVDHFLELHREVLQKKSGRIIDQALWRKGYQLSLYNLMVNRFGLYLMAHTFRHYAFMERTIETLRRLLTIEEGRERGAA